MDSQSIYLKSMIQPKELQTPCYPKINKEKKINFFLSINTKDTIFLKEIFSAVKKRAPNKIQPINTLTKP